MVDVNPKGEWLSGVGPDSDIVISTRLRLARNLEGFPFLSKTDSSQRRDIERRSAQAIAKIAAKDPLKYIPLGDVELLTRLCLVERHLTSRDHANADGDRGIAHNDSERVSILVNEEDHLRIQVMRGGFSFDGSWDEIEAIDDAIEKELPFAFHGQFGYLTACPTNAGTGLRASVMLHLPALVMTKQIEKVFVGMQRHHHAVRGLYGEGTTPLGDFYQISNQLTLGRSEVEIIKMVRDVTRQIIDYERKLRKSLLKERSQVLADRVWRAFGILKTARMMDSEEAMDLLSALRLGIHTGLITGVDIGLVNELFVLIQPGHLQRWEGRKLDSPERDVVRANLLRERLASVG